MKRVLLFTKTTTKYRNYYEIPELLRNTGTTKEMLLNVAVSVIGKGLVDGLVTVGTDASTVDLMHYRAG